MTTIFEIPTSSMPQTMSIALLGGVYQLRLIYCDFPEGGWILDISDADGIPLVCGILLVTGVDLLAQYAYLGIGGLLYVATDGFPDTQPTFGNLGTSSHLYYQIP